HGAGRTSKSVQTFGLSFQPQGEARHIGVAGLAAKILCTTHNGSLSPYDGAGKAMFLAMEGLNAAAGDPAAPHQAFRVDGGRLDRWMLKGLIGGLYSGNFAIPSASNMKGECPPTDLLEILFKGAPFPARQGFYWMPPKLGEMITLDPKVLQFGFIL